MVGPPFQSINLGFVPASGSLSIEVPAPALLEGQKSSQLFLQLIAASPGGYAVLGENDLVVVLSSDPVPNAQGAGL